MLFGRRRVLPLYVVTALAGAAGMCATAVAQTIPSAETVKTDTSTTAGTEAATPTGEELTIASEQPPATTVGSAAPDDAPAVAPRVSAEPGPAEASSRPAAATAETSSPAAPLVIDAAAALARVPNLKMFEKRDRDGLAAAYGAREGRPIWMTAKGATQNAVKLAAEIAKAGDWGLTVSGPDAPALLPAEPDAPDLARDAVADAEIALSLAVLAYAREARGGRFQPTDLTAYLDRKSPLYEPESILEQIAQAAEPDAYLRKLHPQHPQFELLRQRYLAVRDAPAPAKGPSEADRILANMEQWRWMPADLGAFHIWVNIPEQLLRVVRDGRVIHTERIVVGKTNAQTPIFSHEMKHVIFHPFWGVPDSIKTNELLPSLKKGRAILARQDLRIQLGGKDVDPARYDWTRTDIRRFHVYQPPGPRNVLGVVKFMFPNKHAVYMHDTPSKSLFKSAVRAYSHGCIRVQNPVRLAELILGQDRGLPPEKVRALARKGAPENNQINLTKHVPVHMVYFTMWADDSGQIASFKDLYGHEERIRLALAGKMHLIKPVPEPKVPTDPIGRLVEASPSFSGSSSRGGSGFSGSGFSSGVSTSRPDWARRMFSGSDTFAGGN